jgi:hypothetical protein
MTNPGFINRPGFLFKLEIPLFQENLLTNSLEGKIIVIRFLLIGPELA